MGPASTRRPAGLSLIEMLISLTLVSVLMVALVDSMQGFGTQLEAVVAAEDDVRVQAGLEAMGRSVRHAWLADEPSEDTLATTDVYGGVTSYWRDGPALLVERPSGAQGVLVDGLSAFAVDTTSMQRLRPDSDLVRSGTWWSEDVSVIDAMPLVVEEDMPLSLGFTLPAKAPDDVQVVSGVDELVVAASLSSFSVPIQFVEPVEDVAEEVEEEPDDDHPGKGWGPGGSKGGGKAFAGFPSGGAGGEEGGSGAAAAHTFGGVPDGAGSSASAAMGGGKTKVTLCHIPPGNPDNAHTITVGEPALSAHRAHGDTEGACDPGEPLEDPADAELVVELFEGRAPHDGRPFGSALARQTFPVTALTGGSYAWVAAESLGADWTVVCHSPPAQGADYRTQAVHVDELAAHLAHGDSAGSCSDGTTTATTPVLVYTAPATTTSLDLSVFGELIEPGRAYTLEVSLDGRGSLLLRAAPSGSASLSGVAGDRGATGTSTSLPFAVARSITGDVTYTQTRAVDVVSIVSLGVTVTDGTSFTRSASVLGQRAVENPWLGAVPGELPTLDLAGH